MSAGKPTPRSRGSLPPCQGGKGGAGFTLVELLVALVLLSAMTVLLGQGLWLAARTATAVDARAQSAHDGYAAERFLAQQAARARRLSGERDAMQFIAGRHAFSIDTRREADGRRLVLRYGERSAVLAQALQDVQLEYYAAGEWRPEWKEADRLPGLIRLRLTPLDRAAAREEWLMAPRLSAARPES